jgi:diguanylate cyclase (GGDEF)-like protein/PAS domain S-box-containing protein
MMNWSYVFALVVSTAAGLYVSIVAYMRRSAPGARPLMVLGAAIAVWTLTYAIYFAVDSETAGYFWLRATYLGVLTVPTAFLLFSIQYANRSHWLKKKVIALLYIEPVLTFILLWSDPWHKLFFGDKGVDGMILSGGFWFWINVVYSYGLILFAILLIIHTFRHTARPLRGQSGAILVGAMMPLATNLLGVVGLNPFPHLDLTPFAFTITCVCFFVGFMRYGLLDLVPIARDVLIENMTDGVMVLDNQNRLVDVNRMALKMIGKPGQAVIGEPAENVFSNISELFNRFRDTLTTRQEITIGDKELKYYDLRISALYDRKGHYSGRLIVARDISERRANEHQEHEQRVLAEALRDTAAALNSSRTFEDVLDRLLENLGNVVPYDMATFLLLDEQDNIRVARSHGYPEPAQDTIPADLKVTAIPNFCRMIETGRPLVVPDTQQCENWVVIEGLEKIRSYAGAPLRVKGKVIGFLDLTSQIPDFYNQTHADRLQSFADQVAIAVENARLFEETRQRADELSTLLDIGLAVTSGLEMDILLRALLEKCKRVLPIEAFYIATYDNDTGLIGYPLVYDEGEISVLPAHEISQSPGLTGYVIQTRQMLYLPDALTDEVRKKYNIIEYGDEPSHSYVGVPLMVGERVVGVISMQSSHPNAFHLEQIRLLETIATQAAGAIENSRLYEKAQQEIRQREKAEHRYRALFEQSHDGVMILDVQGKHLEVNQRAADILGYTVEELMQLSVTDLSEQKEESGHILERLQKGEDIPLYEREFIKKNGEKVTVEINTEMVCDIDGLPIHIQSVVRDISERKQNEIILQEANQKLRNQLAEIEMLQTQLREQAMRDSLTGLYNRRYLEEALDREFSRAEREKSTVCVVMMDIDGFKAFNDTHGHDAGDLLLRRLGDFLRSEVRSSDISCRYGGEEFLIVMPGALLENGYERAENLRAAFLALDIEHQGVKLRATLSIGVAIYPKHGETWVEVLHAADLAMYAAKTAGRNCTRTSK